MGRPIGSGVIYKEARTGVLIHFGNNLLKKIDEDAIKNKLSRVEYINALVVQADKERALLLARTFSGIKEQINLMMEDKKNEDKKYYECIKKLNRYIGNSSIQDVYERVELDDRGKGIIEKFRQKLLELKAKNSDFPNREHIEHWTELIYSEIQEISFDDGLRIRKPNVVKDAIKKEILNILKQKNDESEK